MISKKNIITLSILGAITIAASTLAIVLPKNNSSKATTAKQPDYINTIFNQDKIININIEMDESEWQNMLDTAIEENYTSANITINDTTYNNVAIRPKGNSSLSQIYNDDNTDRYSFKIKFDKYVDGQSVDGLTELVLNNNMSDTTYMKEYLSYDLLSKLEVPASKCAYANISVNGKPWGLYLAVEPVEKDFIKRYYGSASGNLYKPESDSVVAGANNKDMMQKLPNTNGDKIEKDDNTNFDSSQMNPPQDQAGSTPPDMSTLPNPDDNANIMQTPPSDNKGRMNKNSNGADLVWNGDDISNYSAIFDNAKFKSTTTEDYQKILDMIEHLDNMDDIESYLNVDEVLRYFAVNTFLVNLDSYVSNMKHNYYLYEENGLVSILPWDYNLSFAGFQAGSASNAINFPIDSPVSDSLENSPLIGKLLEVDKYKQLYHKYLKEIAENYVNNGTFEKTIDKIDSLISNYVKNDATAFYTYDEYKNSLSHLKNFGLDRATSILAQLDGTQPSTTAGNIETTVDLTALGQQGGGKDKGGFGGNAPMGNMPDRDVMMKAMEIINSSQDGTITDEITAQLKELGLTDENIKQLTSMPKRNQKN